MAFYKVGGFVRDTIMGLEPKDIDWVVTNETVEQMLADGYKMVGNGFPVFLNPDNGQEFALARTERKVGKGYNGFEFNVENVTIEQDLERRDLTINAMAMDGFDKIIDPFNGQKDLEAKILRHVNADAFREDPVRVLRIARFLARWPEFSVARETKQLCRDIVDNGEMEHLTAERITAEMMKSLSEPMPSRFFYFLRMVGALKIIFPEIHNLIGVEQPYDHHPEGDAFIHTMMVLDEASNQGYGGDPLSCFCALVHDLGKGVTPKEKWPHHYGHEEAGVPLVEAMGERLKLSNKYIECGKLTARYHMHIHKFHELKSKTIVKMFDGLKTKAYPEIMQTLPWISYCDAVGRTSFHSKKPYPNFGLSLQVFQSLHQVKLSDYKTISEIQSMSINQIQDFLYRTKLHIVSELVKSTEI